MDIGRGVRLTVGRGSATNLGDGRRITTVAGFITTTTGPGCRAVDSTANAVGGARRWLHSTSLSERTSAGTRCRTTIAIRIRVITVTTIVDQVTVVAVVAVEVTAAAVAVVVEAVAETIAPTIPASRGVV